MSEVQSTAFAQLDERIQRFIYLEGWEALRDVQEEAIPLILGANQDVIIAASTASGKTEAAMFPALTHALSSASPRLILYISPLKALINDQFGRLTRLCEILNVPVWPWHGDINASVKARFLKKRSGVLLITPEALEALLCNRGSSIASLFGHLSTVIIDELHAFIGSERGKQLQSLLHRIERSLNRNVPRVGLSATLGDMQLAAQFMRPDRAQSVALVQSSSQGGSLKLLIKGYEEPAFVRRIKLPVPKAPESSQGPAQGPQGQHSGSGQEPVGDPPVPQVPVHGEDDKDSLDDNEDAPEPISPEHVAQHLFKNLRGTNNLVFPNSRREVERYTHLLKRLSKEAQVPNEFWPHHGNLSREIRTETELELKQTERPASAICTSTLELGIDIGAVKSVAQIGPPPAVASLRQRLGRSGRRAGESAILRGYCIEDALGKAPSLETQLRLETVKLIAMISLLLEGWFEPPVAHGAHLSTLIQQLLSVIAQQGGATAADLYTQLCAKGAPFQGVTQGEFLELLKHLGAKQILMQESSGELLHGELGEKLVNHYSFYAAFASDEEFRLVCKGKTLGTMPIDQMLREGQRVLFAGKTWLVQKIDEQQKTIFVIRTASGSLPSFASSAGRMHTRVHARMREILGSSQVPPYLDATAQRFLTEARVNYAELSLHDRILIPQGRDTFLLTWLGDAANEALACLLVTHGIQATAYGVWIEISQGTPDEGAILEALKRIARDPIPALDVLLQDAANLQREKWDWALPVNLLRKAYASLNLNVEEAVLWVKGLVPRLAGPHA